MRQTETKKRRRLSVGKKNIHSVRERVDGMVDSQPMDRLFDIKSFHHGFPEHLSRFIKGVKLEDKQLKKIRDNLLKTIVVRVVYTKNQNPILEDETYYGQTFRYVFRQLGNLDFEMENLIKWLEDLDVSCRAIDDYLFRNRQFKDDIYIELGEEHQGSGITYRSPGTSTYIYVQNSKKFQLGKEIKQITKRFGRHGFDSFRRGPIFKWKQYTISICQLHLMYWIRQHDLIKIIKKNRDLIRVQKSVDNTALVQAFDNNNNLTLQSVTNPNSDLAQRTKAKKDLVRQSPDMNKKNKISKILK